MSRTVVGYEGEGKHRRPVYDSPPVDELGFNPPGAIERRQAADHERAGFAPGRVSPGLPTAAPRRVPIGDFIHDDETPAAALIRLAEPPVTPVTPVTPEEPAMTIEPPPEPPVALQSHLEQDPPVNDLSVALAVLNDASLTAIAAYDDHRLAERRWEQAREALIAAYRDTGLLAVQGSYPVGLPSIPDAVEAIRVGIERARDSERASPDTTPAPDFAGAAAVLGVTAAEAEQLSDTFAGGPYVPPASITEVIERHAARSSSESSTDIPEIIPGSVDAALEDLGHPLPAASMASFAAERAEQAAGGGSRASAAARPARGPRGGPPTRRRSPEGGRGAQALDQDGRDAARLRRAEGPPAGGADRQAARAIREVLADGGLT